MSDTLLAFDFGFARIGVAVGQTVTRTASPLTILKARDGIPDWDQVAALVATWQPAALVVGLPINMDGTDNHVTPRARKFANRLSGRYRIPVHLVDERLTTREARNAAPGRERIDDIAATLILETWFGSAPPVT